MFGQFLDSIPTDIINFILVVVFSLLIGLEQRRHHIKDEIESLFGTDRTFTLIGILGFILYILSPKDLTPFLAGGGVIAALLVAYYYLKVQTRKMFGITSLLIALVTYCLGPLIYTQSHVLVILIVVIVLIMTEIKESLYEFSEKFDKDEFITLAKFLVLAGVIVPLLPDKSISDTINFSPFKFSLAIVAVAGISYFSYLLKKFVFPETGVVITGILGGMYSSTATTFILAKKSKGASEGNKTVAAIILATAMMYVRLLLLAFFFNKAVAIMLLPYFGVFVVASVLIAVYFLKFSGSAGVASGTATPEQSTHSNPLELKTSMVFALLFIFFAIITGYVSTTFGSGGINALSLVVGVTDIDPFILNLFQSKGAIANTTILMAVINAVSSNNLLKMVYGVSLSDRSIRKPLILAFSVLIVLGLACSFIIHF